MTSTNGRIHNEDADRKAPCDGSCPKSCGPDVVAALRRENEELQVRLNERQSELDELRNKLDDLGLMALMELSQNQKYRLMVAQMVEEEHEGTKVTPNSLHTLKPNVLKEAKNWLYVKIGDGPKTKDQVNEVFRAPRSPRRKKEDF